MFKLNTQKTLYLMVVQINHYSDYKKTNKQMFQNSVQNYQAKIVKAVKADEIIQGLH